MRRKTFAKCLFLDHVEEWLNEKTDNGTPIPGRIIAIQITPAYLVQFKNNNQNPETSLDQIFIVIQVEWDPGLGFIA